MNNFFNELENTRPFLKMAFEGFSGSGKTYTSAQIAIGLHKKIGSTKPIVYYDTERALKALKPHFDKAGIKVLTRESRSLADLTKTIDLCEGGISDILVIDSITHVWESFVEAYREEKRRTFIQFQDWGILKPKWKKEFSDRLVQSKLHIIFTGRAGYEYDQETNEDTGKKELVKTGIKMKVENETEYEPDIVVLMEKIKTMDGGRMTLQRVANIIKDRTTLIDGKSFINPIYEDFKPAIDLLLDGTIKDTSTTETKDSFQTYEEEIYKKRTEREIALEEIQGILVQLFPGQSAKEKKFKVDLLEKVFDSRSWKAIERFPLPAIKNGETVLKKFKNEYEKYYKECAANGIDPSEEEILSILERVNEENNTLITDNNELFEGENEE